MHMCIYSIDWDLRICISFWNRKKNVQVSCVYSFIHLVLLFKYSNFFMFLLFFCSGIRSSLSVLRDIRYIEIAKPLLPPLLLLLSLFRFFFSFSLSLFLILFVIFHFLFFFIHSHVSSFLLRSTVPSRF